MLSALVFLLLKIFLTGWVIRYSGHSSCRCSYDSNRENVSSVKTDNRSHYRECLSRCRDVESRPGRALERSCSPPPAPRRAQLPQIIPERGWSNLSSPHARAHAHDSQLPWQTALVLSYSEPVWFNLNLPCGSFYDCFFSSCEPAEQFYKCWSCYHISPQLSLLQAAPVLSVLPLISWTLGL